MCERGTYANPNRGRQLIRFDEMRFIDNITPTDIDGAVDFKGKIFVYFEVKHKDAPVPYGQRLALERFVQTAKQANKHGIAIVCEHEVDDAQKDVFLKDCNVREVYTSERLRWVPPKWKITAKEAADVYLRHYYTG